MDYTVYRLTDGIITRSGSGGPQVIAADEGIIYGKALSDTAFRINVETGEEYASAAVKADDLLAAEINMERNRRIASGKVIDGVSVTGRDEDARNLTNLALGAQLRMAGGDLTTLTVFRDGDNIDHDLTPPQILSIWQQSAAYVTALYEASWALKAMDPIPQDIDNPAYWP